MTGFMIGAGAGSQRLRHDLRTRDRWWPPGRVKNAPASWPERFRVGGAASSLQVLVFLLFHTENRRAPFFELVRFKFNDLADHASNFRRHLPCTLRPHISGHADDAFPAAVRRSVPAGITGDVGAHECNRYIGGRRSDGTALQGSCADRGDCAACGRKLCLEWARVAGLRDRH